MFAARSAVQGVSVRRSPRPETSVRAGLVTARPSKGERIDLDDEIAALLDAVRHELSDTIAVDGRTSPVVVPRRWRGFASVPRALIRLGAALRAALARGFLFAFSRRSEIMAYGVLTLVSVSLGVAVALLLGR